MTWTGFRPSDDPVAYPYHIPDNMFVVTEMGVSVARPICISIYPFPLSVNTGSSRNARVRLFFASQHVQEIAAEVYQDRDLAQRARVLQQQVINEWSVFSAVLATDWFMTMMPQPVKQTNNAIYTGRRWDSQLWRVSASKVREDLRLRGGWSWKLQLGE